MDIFKQNRFLVFFIIIMVVLNVGLLSIMWFNTGETNKKVAQMKSPEELRAELKVILQKELDFTAEQIEEYLSLRMDHHHQIQQLRQLMFETKREMFDAALREDAETTISDSLLNLTLEYQADIERLTYNHFNDLKRICNPEQRTKLKFIMHQIIQPVQGEGPGRRPPRRDGPPPSRR